MTPIYAMYPDPVTGISRYYTINGWPLYPDDGKGPNIYNPEADVSLQKRLLREVPHTPGQRETKNPGSWIEPLILWGSIGLIMLLIVPWNLKVIGPRLPPGRYSDWNIIAASLPEALGVFITFVGFCAWFVLLIEKSGIANLPYLRRLPKSLWPALGVALGIIVLMVCCTVGPIQGLAAPHEPFSSKDLFWGFVTLFPFFAGIAGMVFFRDDPA